MLINVKQMLRTFGYYDMSNIELAQKCFKDLLVDFPDLIMINEGIHQHFILTEDRKNQLINKMNNKKNSLEEELKGVNSALTQLGL